MLMLEEDSDSSVAKDADDDDHDDDDDIGVDSSTGNCLASTSQHVYLPDSQLQFHKCRDVNADRPAKVDIAGFYLCCDARSCMISRSVRFSHWLTLHTINDFNHCIFILG